MDRPAVMSQSESRSEPTSLQNEESFIIIGRSSSPSNPSLTQVVNGPVPVNNSSNSQTSIAASGFPSSILLSDLSPDEIQNKIQALVQENVELKEALRQNNLAMKQQFDTLVMWQEEVFKVHQNHKKKFEETKDLVLKLRSENAELRKLLTDLESTQSSSSAGPDVAKLQSENAILRRKVAEAEAKEKVVVLKEFQMKKEIADLKEQLEEVQKLKHPEANRSSPVLPSKQQSKTPVALKVEKEELGGDVNHLEISAPPAKSPVGSFVVVDQGSMKLPAKKEASREDTARQLEECRRVLDVERQALEEDRKALEKNRRAMHARVLELDEQRKNVEMQKEVMEKRLAALSEELEREKELRKKEARTEEGRPNESANLGLGHWEMFGVPGEDVGMPVRQCESHLGMLREYLITQEKKNVKIEVWLQKVHQIIVSLIAIDPDKGKELKEEALNLRKQITEDADELARQRSHLLEAENFLTELKLGFDTIQAKAASVSTVIKENAEADYHKAQARGYRQQLDDATARLTQAEEALQNTRSEAANLAERLRRTEIEMEAIPILKTQVDVYQADFNTEREERARMAAEKQQLVEEVGRLRIRNQNLLDDLENIQRRDRQENRSPPDGISSTPVGGGGSPRINMFNTLAAPGRGYQYPYGNESQNQLTPEAPRDRSTRGSSEPRIYTCPKCFRAFTEIGPLEVHVNQCLDNM